MPTYLPQHFIHAHLPAPPPLPESIPELRVADSDTIPIPLEAYNSPQDVEHAVSVVHDAATNILARSIANGYVLELRPFSPTIGKSRPRTLDGSEIIRVFFPAKLRTLAEGSIVVSHRDQLLYVYALTETNQVYRLNFPLGNFRPGTGDRFVFTTRGGGDWSEQFEPAQEDIVACGGVGAWTVLDEDTVVLGGGDGGIVKMTRTGNWDPDSGRWATVHHRSSSKFRPFSIFSRSADSHEQIISFARFDKAKHASILYTLSRDRKLRAWSVASGACLRTVDLRAASQALAPRNSPSTSSVSTEDGSTNLIRVIPHPNPSSRFSHLVVGFVSTPHSADSAGSFVVYRAQTSEHGISDLAVAGEKHCSSASAGAELRGFEITPPVKMEGVDSGWRLWAAWDRAGLAFGEAVWMDSVLQFTTYIESHDSPLLADWQPVSSTHNIERFDAVYFDNLLSPHPPNPAVPEDNGDIDATFIQHLFHPGRFSTSSLQNGLEEYTKQLNARSRQAHFQLASSFPTLSKRYVGTVGSHVQMGYSAETGAALVEVYRRDLKLEWLRVWAAVRDLDRAARWPVRTTAIGQSVLVLTREGVSTPVPEDTAGALINLDTTSASELANLPPGALRRVYPHLGAPEARKAVASVALAGGALAGVLKRQEQDAGDEAVGGTGTIFDLATRYLNEVLAQGLQGTPEAVAAEVWDEYFERFVSESEKEELRRVLSHSGSVSRAIVHSLEILESTAFPLPTEIDAELGFSGLGNALLASAVAQVVESRYTLARDTLFIALFHLMDGFDPATIADDDEGEELIAILSRAMVVYHRYRVLKWVSSQPGAEAAENLGARGKSGKGKRKQAGTGDDVDGLDGGDDLESDSDGFVTGGSLLHGLFARHIPQAVPSAGSSINIYLEAAFGVLERLGLLSPGETELGTQAADVVLGNLIFVDGHWLLAGEYTELYPLSAGLTYVRGRVCLELGGENEAAKLLEKAASGCTDGSLIPVLPSTAGPNGLSAYYTELCTIFRAHGAQAPVIAFGQLAIETAKEDGPSTRDLWTKVFVANLELGLYEAAYGVLANMPFMDLKREFLGALISEMCEKSEVGRLNQMGFIGFQKDVEELLRFKARNSDPLRNPNYYKVLYSWHITRGDYRSAGETMYLQGRRVAEATPVKNITALDLAIRQARSYLASINALSLIDKRNAWVSVPSVPNRTLRGVKRRRVTSFIPEEEFTQGKRPVDLITLQDIQMEYTMVLARVSLTQRIPDLLEHGVSVSPEEIVGLLVQQGMYDLALSSAATLEVDMTEMFKSLATRCVELSRLPEHTGDWSTAAFLQNSPITSRLRGPPSALAMHYLKTALTRHDSPKTNWRYREAVADTLFEKNRDKSQGWQTPVWLSQWEMERDPEGWIGRALRWGWVAEAVDWSVELLRKTTPPELLPKDKSEAVYVPYALFDRVLAATAEGDEKDEKDVQAKAEVLRSEVARRLKGLRALKA
ncbi:hypothetical protein IAT38_002646 [Cryptococcus sp. DSM 104549]